ncbi:hypothetical protein EDC94DRAFT_652690 [Helicostylum pulchrum]|nr:hypothetical protein EDC94DRAFT_652690 [Helicostylum pulchrum]
MNPFSQSGMPILNRKPVCCAAIPIGIGIPLVLTSWIGISLYFASLSFMGKSPFYTYFNTTAILVFGTLNITFVVICIYGYSLHLFRRSFYSYRQYAKLLACWVAAILIDMLVNFIVFCIKKNEFQSRCLSLARVELNFRFENSTLLNQSIQDPTIVFNCKKLFIVEAEFSFACTVLMVMIYVYWVSFIIKVSRNFVLRGPEIRMQPGLVPMQQQAYPNTPIDIESPKDIILT